MSKFFMKLHVGRANSKMEAYYPNFQFLWNSFKKIESVPAPNFTIGILIKYAEVGKWLYN